MSEINDNRNDNNEIAETSPLLPDNNAPQHVVLDDDDDDAAKWSTEAIRTASLAVMILILYAFADVLKYTATVQLIEVGVCREHYPNTDTSANHEFCKSPPVQQELAHLRGYLSALEAIVGLVLTLPYGLLVGRLGEPLLAGVNVVGYLLSCAWLVVVCFYHNVFPIWTVVLSPLWRVVGGGSPFFMSVIYSITAKHVPAANR